MGLLSALLRPEDIVFSDELNHASIIDGIRLLASTEGIFTETAGGVVVASAEKLIRAGRIAREESLVLCITGNGLKTQEVLTSSLKPAATIKPSLAEFEKGVPALAGIGNHGH